MSVDDQDIAAGYGAHNLPCYVLEKPDKGADRQRQGALCPVVLGRKADGNRRKQPQVKLGPRARDYSARQLFCNHHVGVQWQMGAMLLDR